MKIIYALCAIVFSFPTLAQELGQTSGEGPFPNNQRELKKELARLNIQIQQLRALNEGGIRGSGIMIRCKDAEVFTHGPKSDSVPSQVGLVRLNGIFMEDLFHAYFKPQESTSMFARARRGSGRISSIEINPLVSGGSCTAEEIIESRLAAYQIMDPKGAESLSAALDKIHTLEATDPDRIENFPINAIDPSREVILPAGCVREQLGIHNIETAELVYHPDRLAEMAQQDPSAYPAAMGSPEVQMAAFLTHEAFLFVEKPEMGGDYGNGKVRQVNGEIYQLNYGISKLNELIAEQEKAISEYESELVDPAWYTIKSGSYPNQKSKLFKITYSKVRSCLNSTNLDRSLTAFKDQCMKELTAGVKVELHRAMDFLTEKRSIESRLKYYWRTYQSTRKFQDLFEMFEEGKKSAVTRAQNKLKIARNKLEELKNTKNIIKECQ